jgi:hypothetical protein
MKLTPATGQAKCARGKTADIKDRNSVRMKQYK